MHVNTLWFRAASEASWFRLDRHDDPEPADPPEPEPTDDPEPEPEPEPEGDLGDAGKRALQKERAEKAKAKREAAEAKRRADELARRVAEFEDRDKSEAEKLAARAEAAQKRAEAATARAVKAEVRAAASDFADPDDAAAFLSLDEFTDADGAIDTDAIEAALADLLDRKPHLRKAGAPAEPERPKPKPDPGQGSRGPVAPVDFRSASKDEVAAELAKYSYRQRW